MSNNNNNNDQRKPTFSGGYNPGVGGISRNSPDHDEDFDGPSRRAAFYPASVAFQSTSSYSSPMMMSTLSSVKQQPQITGTTISSSSSKLAPTTSAVVWELRDIPTLPAFHPLERTAVFVPHTSCRDVATRVSTVLRDRSIETEYDNDKAKVKCITPDGVDFRVRLYRGRDTFDHGVIVEVQRRFGSSVNFHQDTQAILDAAEGKAPSPPPPSFGFGSLPMVSDSEDSSSEADGYEVNATSSLSMVATMLKHCGYDSHYLAYQTLIALTSTAKMGSATARAISQELLRPGNVVGAKVVALVLAGKDEEDMFKLRTMALTVLANAFQATKGSDVDMMLREQLRPVLLQELARSEQNPRNAQMAAICVQYMLPQDHDPTGFYDALEQARKTGEARHEGLRQQAQRCLDLIQGSS